MLRTYWHADNTPIATTIDQLLYDLRKDDGADGLIFDAVSFADIIEDADGRIALDAMLSPYNKLETKMGILQKVMERAGTEIKPVSQQLSEPFTQNGTANVACIFELSDGQTISVFFHNPDTTPKKIMPTDEMVSWKWLLNKKDITIVVAPEKGKDLNVRQVATRLMKLAEKNSSAFQRTNAKRAEKMQALEGLKTEVAGLEKTLKDKQHELEVAKIEAEDRGNQANQEVTDLEGNEIIELEDKIEHIWTDAPVNNYVVTMSANNASKVRPLPGKSFSENDFKLLIDWIKANGWLAWKEKNYVYALGEGLKDKWYDIPDANRITQHDIRVQKYADKQAKIEAETQETLKHPAAQWIARFFGDDFTTPWITASLVRFITGEESKTGIFLNRTWLKGMLALGATTEQLDGMTRMDILEYIKSKYQETIEQTQATPEVITTTINTNNAPESEPAQGIDPIAKSNIEAANISAAIKKKAIAYLNANPASHEIKGLSTKSLDAIMENIKTAFFAEIKSLSPLIKQSKLMGGDSLILNIGDDGKDSIKILFSDGSYRLSFMVVKDFEGKEIFDSTSTLEGLREWGFALPFDLDVKAFVANVIKPVVDEFLIKHEGVKNAVISMWDKVLGMTKEEFSEKVFSGNIVINDSINPNHTNQKTISQMVDFLNMIDDAHPNDRDDHGFTDYKKTIERQISDLYDDAEVSKKMAEAGIVNHNEYITFLDEPAGSEEQQKTTGKIEGVKNLIGIALSRTDGNKAFSEIGEVSPEVAEKVKLVTGIDVDGFVHGIDEAAIRHVFEEHGDVEAENKRGQIAVTAHDIANLSAVVMSPDDIQKGDEENTIEVSKRIGSEVLVVQEIRTGRKKLVLKTMWKKPISAPDAPLEVSPAEASETFGNQAQENTTTNPQPDATDNSDIDSEIESLKQLIGTPEFSDALDRLLDKLEATGLESQYESIVSDIIIQDAQAESAKVGV